MAVQPQISARGGFYTSTSYSGTLVGGPDVALTLSGQNRGRLNTITFFNFVPLSGAVVNFYDGANVGVNLASGGPIPGSGHIMLYQFPNYPTTSAQSGIANPAQTVINVDAPFFSGLNLNQRSGGPGWTASWTVEKPLY